MEITIRAASLEREDPWIAQFVRTTVCFAIAYYEPVVERVEVSFERVEEADGSHHRCALAAETRDRGPIGSGATGTDLCEAVTEAANLLEVALHRPQPPARLAA